MGEREGGESESAHLVEMERRRGGVFFLKGTLCQDARVVPKG